MGKRTVEKSVTVGFAGMTHLGLVSSAATADAGFKTICYDTDIGLIESLRKGNLPVREPHLDNLVAANSARLTFTSDQRALGDCNIVYISIDVPTDDEARSDLSVIDAQVQRVIPHLNATALLVILCQVPPGFTRSIKNIPLERLYCQVETLVFGRAVERAQKPERYIVGCAAPERPIDPRLQALFSAFSCPVLPMRYESAELAKIAINCCLVASIGVTNTLAELSEEIGADWNEIMPSLRLDARIGPKAYLSPGLGIAGGNLERDLQTVIGLARRHNTDSGMIVALLANSDHCKTWAARMARRLIKPGATLAVWGLAYKENTHSTKNSPSLASISLLQDYKIAVHDPAVPITVVNHPDARATAEPLDALHNADLLMILTPWPQYREIAPNLIAESLKGLVVLDPFRVLDPSKSRSAGLDWHTLGVPFVGKS